MRAASWLKQSVLSGYLRLLRRKQFTSLRLRSEYRRRYSVDVGLYSYGCFDERRVRGPVKIGRYCSFADTAHVINANHPVESGSTHPFFYDPQCGVVALRAVEDRMLVIEDDVWVGHNAVILPGCTYIGRGAVIGAGAIVTHDVPAYAIVGGIPARKLRDRFAHEIIETMERLRWWTHEPRHAWRLISGVTSQGIDPRR